MTLATHGDQKYHNREKLAETSDWPTLSIEHRKFEAGRQATPVPICTEVILLLSGGGMVCRSGNGEVQKSLARPGMSYLVPVGTQENYLELSDRMECLHLYLPPTLLDRSALADFDIDPAKVQIAYADGLTDRRSILGYPAFVDPFMPAMANPAESIAFGDMSKYFVRIVNGVRFERSDEFRFQNDLVAFRCILRLDGALVDTGAVKTFVNTT